jgi:putative endonuclease
MPRTVWYLYIAQCGDGSLYTGITKDLRARFAQHNAGTGAKYTRSRGPVTLLRQCRCASVNDALGLEHAVKSLPRLEKLALVCGRRLYRFAQAWLRNRAAQRRELGGAS